MTSRTIKALTDGSFVLDLSVNLQWILSSALLGLFVMVALRWKRAPDIPFINAYPGDFALKKAHAKFLESARSLIVDGTTKFNGPFRIITTLGSRVILPPSFTDWVKNCRDLDHQALVAEEFFAAYPGFEGIKVITDPSRMVIDVIRNKLSQNGQCQVFHEQITKVLKEAWTDEQEWHSIDWSQDVKLTITYTVNAFMATRALRAWPEFMRPIVHWFLPECIKCRAQVKLARRLLQGVLDRRARARAAALAEGHTPEKYDDTRAWMEEAAAGRPFDAVAAQLAFAMSALHTTSELLKQTLLDVCRHPELIQPIRDEVNAAVSESGWTTAGLFKMQLLDSVVKESQRLKPGTLVNLERRALRDVIMPNGVKLPRSTHIAVDSSQMWNPDVYENPQTFDGYRFLRIRQEGGKRSKTASVVSTSPDHFAFGMGKPICPGRFFAANEIKIALAHILLNYDVRLQHGYEPKIVELGFEMLADPAQKVQVRRRQ